jgi:hypothetical protein
VTVRDADVEYTFDDPDEGWFGMARPADVVPARPAERPPLQDPPAEEPVRYDGQAVPEDVADDVTDTDTDRWFVHDMNLVEPVDVTDRPAVESVAATLDVVPMRRNGFVGASSPSWESRLSSSGAWDFKATSGTAWYRSRAVAVAAAIIVGVLAIIGVVLVLRSPAAGEGSPPATPGESTAPSVPTTPTPALSTEAPLPPPPPPPGPPPPPPSAEQVSPVVPRQYTPNYQTPDEPKKPQTNVTRAPMSATPPPPPKQTDRGRATPGESGHHGFFG